MITDEHYKRLSAAFAAVHNPQDWRAPIDTTIAVGQRAVTVEAIQFFTATEAVVTDLGAGQLRIKSIGYRAGPAGDH